MPVSVTGNTKVYTVSCVCIVSWVVKLRKINELIKLNKLFTLCSLLCAFCFWGCGYSIHGRASLPFDSIQIGKIENLTVEPKLQDRLHKALTDEFLKQGIAVYHDADYKLNGTINQFELRILSEKADIATEYEVIIKGDFRLIDPSGNVKEFKNIISPFIVSFSGPGPLDELIASKELASEKAIKDMAMEIVGILIYR